MLFRALDEMEAQRKEERLRGFGSVEEGSRRLGNAEIEMEVKMLKDAFASQKSHVETMGDESLSQIQDLRQRITSTTNQLVKSIQGVKQKQTFDDKYSENLTKKDGFSGSLALSEVEYLKNVVNACEKRIDDETTSRIKLEEGVKV
jgi:hypothetical protein